jgi:hypothetical protein
VVQGLGAILVGAGYFFPTKVLMLKDKEESASGLLLPLGPGGGPGLTWSLTFGL